VNDSDTLNARIAALEHELDALRRTQAVLALGLSHDLRTPLRAIESFSYLLEQKSASLDDTAREHLRRIRDASHRLHLLVGRLQAWIHAGEAPLAMTEVDLSMLADWCIGELRDADPQREADIDVAPGLQVRGDERLLKCALQEVLHNAWIYSAPDARVRIRVEGERAPQGRLLLRVHDHGIGFDDAHACKLGEPFQRLRPAEPPEGCGLGLAIARRIVERHGGHLRLEGETGAGAVVHFDLPSAETA
jgi:signal transduction histidine kinase